MGAVPGPQIKEMRFRARVVVADIKQGREEGEWSLSVDDMRNIIDDTYEIARACKQAGDARNFNSAARLLISARKWHEERQIAMQPKQINHTGQVVLSLPDNGRENTGLPVSSEPILIDAHEVEDSDGVSVPE